MKPQSDDLFNLAGKTALVTGGVNGLGRMIAEGLLRAGADVVVSSRKADACARAQEEMSAIGRCTAIAADFSSLDAVPDFAARLGETHEALDILVNNSGKTWSAPIETFPDKAWASILTINLQVPYKLVQALLPSLERRASADDPSRVINIGSIAGLIVEPLQAYSYSSSKAAVHHLTRQLAADLAPRNINVNTLVPGYFPTTMTAHLQDDQKAPKGMLEGHIPLRRFGRASDIAGAAIFLASRAGAYVSGSELVVDGGLSGCR
jgi:NAD(P)-dependent dehydrogenase (short-subunit alcohol dehydrogenase family)